MSMSLKIAGEKESIYQKITRQKLLSNLPPATMLEVPQKLPIRWDSVKSSVIDVYLRESVVAEDKTTVPSIRSLETEWRKKVFEK